MADKHEKSGEELLTYLKETGTGSGRLEAVESYLRHHPEASAAEVLGHLIHQRVQPGTIEKVGRWLHGDGFRYSGETPSQTPEEELRALRRKTADQETLIRGLEADKHRLTQRVAQLEGVRLGRSDLPEAREPRGSPRGNPQRQKQDRQPQLATAGAP